MFYVLKLNVSTFSLNELFALAHFSIYYFYLLYQVPLISTSAIIANLLS